MHQNDMELRLLRGAPISVDGVGKLHPLTLGEISDIGELEYNKLISIVTFKQDDLVIDEKKLTPFESIVLYSYHDEQFRQVFSDSLSKFFKEEVHYHKDSGLFYLGSLQEPRVIDEEKYTQIVEVVKKQNFIKDGNKEEEYNPADEKTAELIEKLKKIKARIKEQNQEKGLELHDIISIVGSLSPNYDMFNIWGLTCYQLYTVYIRTMMKDSYESNFYLLPHVSDQSSLKMEHWARKLEDK